MKARELMTEAPGTVTTVQTITDAAKLMRDLDVGIIPVVEDGSANRLLGVITDRDIAVRHVAEGHREDCTVSGHMSEAEVTAGPDDDVKDVLRKMQDAQLRRVPVVEDGNRLVGIIAQADIALRLGASDVEETVERISEPARPRR